MYENLSEIWQCIGGAGLSGGAYDVRGAGADERHLERGCRDRCQDVFLPAEGFPGLFVHRAVVPGVCDRDGLLDRHSARFGGYLAAAARHDVLSIHGGQSDVDRGGHRAAAGVDPCGVQCAGMVGRAGRQAVHQEKGEGNGRR